MTQDLLYQALYRWSYKISRNKTVFSTLSYFQDLFFNLESDLLRENSFAHLFGSDAQNKLPPEPRARIFFEKLNFTFIYLKRNFVRCFFTFFVFQRLFSPTDSNQHKELSFAHLLIVSEKKKLLAVERARIKKISQIEISNISFSLSFKLQRLVF